MDDSDAACVCHRPTGGVLQKQSADGWCLWSKRKMSLIPTEYWYLFSFFPSSVSDAVVVMSLG